MNEKKQNIETFFKGRIYVVKSIFLLLIFKTKLYNSYSFTSCNRFHKTSWFFTCHHSFCWVFPRQKQMCIESQDWHFLLTKNVKAFVTCFNSPSIHSLATLSNMNSDHAQWNLSQGFSIDSKKVCISHYFEMRAFSDVVRILNLLC